MSPRAASTDGAADPARLWIVVGMLCLLMLINFADRAVLGLAAVPIMREMGLSHSEFGLIAASFFTFFSLSAAIGGFLVNRVATTWVLAGLALIWSLCQLPMLLPVTVTALVANRVLLGFGEGPAYPVAVHAAYKWFPREHRALPTSLIAVGALAGNGIVAPVIVTVIAAWSWQAAFGLLGLLGIVWCVAWLMVAREGPLVAEGRVTGSVVEPEKQLSYRRLLGCRTVVGVEIVGFSAYWLLTIAIVWLPAFLHQAFGYTPIQAGWIMMLASLCQIILLPGVSSLSDGLKRRGVSSRIAGGWVACAAVLASGLMVILMSLSTGSVLVIVCTVVAFSLCNVMFVLGPVLVADVTPVAQRGAALGMVNAITTLAGPFAPTVMGVMVDASAGTPEGTRNALLLSGLLAVVGASAGFVLIDPEADRARDAPSLRMERSSA
ncbi:MFS transporter [Microvirga terrae]|uniref:MFS transporter n=1 Tax=Microvirga terrae TaxID=2740529 RepID=A0ABY5RP74_9HYPH|nr:MFS transporter [Microvirga terrae]UVF17814.1 MFS transporter [Microvirga terrae]